MKAEIHKAHCLSGIPGVLIHGRLDLGGPLVTPWRPANRQIFILIDEHITSYPLQDQWDKHFERNGVLVFGLNAVGRVSSAC
jgi:hypothetical protein